MSAPSPNTVQTPALRSASAVVTLSGRELARVGERFYAGELRITFVLVTLAAGLAALLGVIETVAGGSLRSAALAIVVALGGAWATSRAEAIYSAMRARPVLTLVPAVALGCLLALDGSLDSPLYLPAQAVPVVAAVAGSVALALSASGVMAALYLIGVMASGRTLSGEDTFLVAASVLGFLAWAVLFGLFAQALTAFVLRLPVVTAPPASGPRPARRVRIGVQVVSADRGEVSDAAPDLPFRLTARQLQVAVLVSSGLTTAEIARELGIAPGTVDRHITTAMRRAGVTSRSHLSALIAASGLVADAAT